MSKTVTFFYFCDVFVRFYPILLSLAETYPPQKSLKKHVHGPIHILLYMFVLYLVKSSDASERALRRRPLPVLVIEPESRNFFKGLFKLLVFQPLSVNSRINFQALEPLNSCKFSIKMRTPVAPGCCMIWSGHHQRVIGEAIDHVAWTAE